MFMKKKKLYLVNESDLIQFLAFRVFSNASCTHKS